MTARHAALRAPCWQCKRMLCPHSKKTSSKGNQRGQKSNKLKVYLKEDATALLPSVLSTKTKSSNTDLKQHQKTMKSRNREMSFTTNSEDLFQSLDQLDVVRRPEKAPNIQN